MSFEAGRTDPLGKVRLKIQKKDKMTVRKVLGQEMGLNT